MNPYSTFSADFSHLFDALDPTTASSCNPITPPSGYICPSLTGSPVTTVGSGANSGAKRPAPMASHKSHKK